MANPLTMLDPAVTGTTADPDAYNAEFNQILTKIQNTPTASTIPYTTAAGKLQAGYGGTASTLATLNSSTKVVENPASASAAPTANQIPITDSNGEITLTVGAVNSNVLDLTGTHASRGASIKLTGDGATTPAKYIKSHGGVFEVANNADSTILTLTDAGALSTAGGILATQWSGNTIHTGYDTWDPGDLAQFASATTTFAVSGVNTGIATYITVVSPEIADIEFFTIVAWVSATNVVSVKITNMHSSNKNLGSGTWRIMAIRPTAGA